MAAPPRPGRSGSKPYVKGDVDDLASLANLDDATLLNELKARYQADKIYTYVGDILVAVNPFKDLPLYSSEVQFKYHDVPKSSAPPHIFALADQAYHTMLRNGHSQCAVISGESGAGKTESAKYLMRHIISLCPSGGEGAQLERRIIEVNPMLEAFGNAATLMNHNSSRFGKYTELLFDKQGHVVGAQISEYLLEKSRVVRQNMGENNFHVLYYIFAAPNAQELALTDYRAFPYTAACANFPRDNKERYQELVAAMKTIGFSQLEQADIHQVLAAVLHISNITFDSIYSGSETLEMSNSQAVLDTTSRIVGVSSEALKEAFVAVNTVTRGEKIRRINTPEKAMDTRDAMSKALYGRLFTWIVGQINQLLAVGSRTTSDLLEIGVLDIFGFEHFETNGFEQLCINIANEQLQSFFNQHIFKQELAEYAKEGIDGSAITFEDNQPLLDMCFNKPIGLFALLDEESRFPRATDETLVEKFKAQLANNAHYHPEKTSAPCFTIQHYAGNIKYTSWGFLARNRDELSEDVKQVCRSSNNELIKRLFSDEKAPAPTGRGNNAHNTVRQRAATVGAQFVSSLMVLMDKMMQCMAHFVRCIKPNTQQAPNNFVDDFVNRQLRYTGMLETTRIRREGYSFRPEFADFMVRFGILADGAKARADANAEACRKVLTMSGVQGWLLGKTKVFLKYWQVEQLDKAIKRFHDGAGVLQKVAKGFLARRYRANMVAKMANYKQQAASFFDTSRRNGDHYSNKAAATNAEDMRRHASGAPPRRPSRPSAPKPKRSEKELKREASIMWWQEKEQPIGAGQDVFGNFLPWFHGLISRQEAEELLKPRFIGCFLVRVSENRFGYTLSYRVSNRCRHYKVEQDTQHRYALVGVEKVCNSLNELIEWFQRNPINADGDVLREACGQKVGDDGFEECDYGELLSPDQLKAARQKAIAQAEAAAAAAGPPPPVVRANKPGAAPAGAGGPPPVVRANKPGAAPAAGGPPPVSRGNKPRL